MTSITATKTALPNGKTRYEVFVNGELDQRRSMTSKVADYEIIHVQRWAAEGDHSRKASDGSSYGDGDHFAARFSRKPRPVGSKLEYGFVAANVQIQEL
jgi:hypothetical protein